MYEYGDAGPRPPPIEYCSTYLVCDGSSVTNSLMVRVSLNIWHLVLLLYVYMYMLHYSSAVVRTKSTKREGVLAHFEQHCTLHTCTTHRPYSNAKKMWTWTSGCVHLNRVSRYIMKNNEPRFRKTGGYPGTRDAITRRLQIPADI